jgi:hypothetical protein
MRQFFWTSGHLGWGFFAFTVYTCLWFLLIDLYWRNRSTRMANLLTVATSGWIIGAGLIILIFWFANR